MKSVAAPEKGGPRVNRDIRAVQVQLIDAEGHNRGVTNLADAIKLAEDASLDLVEIVPNASPPVCKILDFGKFRFLEQKKSAEQRKRQKIVEIKEIKLRPGIDDHDYEVKMRSVRRFFEEGDKVKVTLRFRGREMAHQDIGFRLLQRVKTETAPIAKVEAEPLMEGRQMVMVLAPKEGPLVVASEARVPLPLVGRFRRTVRSRFPGTGTTRAVLRNCRDIVS
jgi:translation initiation factor IF-3